MLNKKILISGMLAGLMTLSSCNEEGVNVEDVNKQTILMYLPWSGSDTDYGLYDNLTSNIDSIKAAIKTRQGLKGTRLLVFLSESNNQSKLFEIEYTQQGCQEKVIKTYEGTNYTTESGITDIWKTVKEEAPALNYAMMIGGHGTGWTYKEDWASSPSQARQLRNKIGTRFFGSSSDMKYEADVKTLAEGIRNTGIKLQYILFDNCNMANIETVYELKDVTNFFIGSTCEILTQGLPYKQMWSMLNTTAPNYSSMPTTMVNYYKGFKAKRDRSGALSVIDCRKLDELAKVMKDIHAEYTFDESRRDSIQILGGYKTPIFYDMTSYVDQLKLSKKLQNEYDAAMTSVVRAKASTDSIFTSVAGNRIMKINTNCGLTISEPSKNPVVSKGLKKTAWYQATH